MPPFQIQNDGLPHGTLPHKVAQWPHYCSGQGRRPAPGKNLGPAVGRAEGPHLENFGRGPAVGQGRRPAPASAVARQQPIKIIHRVPGKSNTLLQVGGLKCRASAVHGTHPCGGRWELGVLRVSQCGQQEQAALGTMAKLKGHRDIKLS